MKKTGEVTTSMLVTLILLIVGFSIVIIFLYNVVTDVDTKDQLCHSSVISRATLPSAAQSYVPLACESERICITTGDGLFNRAQDCSELAFLEEGEEKETIKIRNEVDIAKVVSEEMAECWNTMGEGKASIFNEYFVQELGFGSIHPSCVVCSRLVFNQEALESRGIKMEDVDIGKYMETHRVPGTEEYYADYFGGDRTGGEDFDPNLFTKGELMQLAENLGEDGEELQKALTNENVPDELVEADDGQLEASYEEIAIVFSQISAPEYGSALSNLGKLTLGGGSAALITTRGRIGSGVVTLVKAAPYSALAGILGSVAVVGGQYFNVGWQQDRAAKYCGDFSQTANPRSGCSTVRAVKWDEENIRAFCHVIEGSV